MSAEAAFYAYVHARPGTTDARGVFYVGKGQGARHQDFYHRNPHHKNIVNKHGAKNILIGRLECSDEGTAMHLEQGLIKCLRRSGVVLANVTAGGEGLSGHRHSAETKAKMRAARLGWVPSAETREKLRKFNLGKPGTFTGKTHTAETKAKISAAHKGKPHPAAAHPLDEATKAKISATKLAKPMVDCPHCGVHGRQGGAMARYHFDNCKWKGSN